MPKFSAVVPTPATEGDFEEMMIKRIQPAAQIVAEMMHEAAHILQSG